jgi:hypothetical protein
MAAMRTVKALTRADAMDISVATLSSTRRLGFASQASSARTKGFRLRLFVNGIKKHEPSGDLRHLRRRREALERGGEDGPGFGEAGARTAEFGERQRRRPGSSR